jgi:hypothetical protein
LFCGESEGLGRCAKPSQVKGLAMNMYWVYDLPNWLFGALTISLFVTVGLGGYFGSRKWVRSLHHEYLAYNDIVGCYFGAITVLYGITLGLLMVGVWSNFSDTDQKVSREAATLSTLYHDVSHYPEPIRSQLQRGLKDYCRDVITVAWPQQRKGMMSMSGRLILRKVEDQMISFEPATEGQMALHTEALRQFNQLREERRTRLDGVRTGLSSNLWALVLIGAFINIAVTWFFHAKDTNMHFWMTMLLSSLLGLMIFLLAAMDHPYLGNLSVGSDAFQVVYEQTIQAYDRTADPDQQSPATDSRK